MELIRRTIANVMSLPAPQWHDLAILFATKASIATMLLVAMLMRDKIGI